MGNAFVYGQGSGREVYVWEKTSRTYEIVTRHSYINTGFYEGQTSGDMMLRGTAPVIDNATGYLSVESATEWAPWKNWTIYISGQWICDAESAKTAYLAVGSLYTGGSSSGHDLYFAETSQMASLTIGEPEYVVSFNENAFPSDGMQDGFFYRRLQITIF